MSLPGQDAPPDFVRSLARGLAVIRAFDAGHPQLSLSDVARRADVSRAAAGRFLRTLEALGYVAPSTGSGGEVSTGSGGGVLYRLTPRVLELGFSYLSALSLPEIVQPHLEALSRDVDESVSAAVLDGDEIVYIARVPTRRIMSVRITIGTRFPAYATSMGRVLLAALPDAARDAAIAASVLAPLTDRTIVDSGALVAELDRVRADGWALIDGELEPGLRSVAAPVHGRDGQVIAAINVSTSATRDSLEHLSAQYLPRLLATAADIDADVRLV